MHKISLRKLPFQFALFMLISITLFSCNRQKVSDRDIEEKIQAMSLEEKIDFIGGYKGFNIRGYENLGIPEIRFADGPVGVRNYGKSTAYPAAINLAASWNKKMAYDIGKAIGSEARAKNVHVMLGPAMNIYRLPLCGRNFEYLGEDPYLAGQMAKDFIIGMQDQGVMATAKHFVANNQEFNRHQVSSDVDERTLHEIYLPAFKTSVISGKVAAVMTSYNPVNGIHASQHDELLNNILKGQWGFEGFVMSDWVSTYDGLACAKGGLDLEMPSGKLMSKENLLPAIESGELNVSVIDDKIRRILHEYQRFGFFENPDISKGFNLDERFARQTSLQAAREGMVLLKNDEGFLPLDKDKIKSIAVIGPNGFPAISGGGGSSKVDPLHPLSLFEAVKEVAGEGISVEFEKGVYTGIEFPQDMFDKFDFYVHKNDKEIPGVDVEYFANKTLEGKKIYKTHYDKLNLENSDMWGVKEVPETDFSARFTCFYRPKASGVYSFGLSGDDGYRLYVDNDEVIENWRDQGETKSKYDCSLNFGQEYKIVVEYYQSGGAAVLRLGAAKAKNFIKPEEYQVRAVEAAKKADLVIFSGGFNPNAESEGFDRTFAMPYKQDELINLLTKVNKNIVVVLNAGGNVEMESWIDNVKALLMAWYPGQEGNLAAAEILFGITNPSGKLPASFAYDINENPAYTYYFDDDNDLRVGYGEGIFLGYRYWDRSKIKPRFPFGFGLSYTGFNYDEISTDKKVYSEDDTVEVSVIVKNIGQIDGAEVVQLYVSDNECKIPRPEKELKAFSKVYLKSGEEKTVNLRLQKDAFAFYNPKIHSWEVEPGEFDLLIGSSSTDIKQKANITINLSE